MSATPLPPFRLLRPASVAEALAACREHPDARYLGGGTDLLVNMRRGLGSPPVLIDLTALGGFDAIVAGADGLRIGAGVTVAGLLRDPVVAAQYPALQQAAAGVAAPGHRNLGTVGGNLCLDTRCIYFNQSEWWRAANDHCLKYGGTQCHVAPEGQRCHAAYSGDLAPALMVAGASVEIAGPSGTRTIALEQLYAEDGRAHLQLAAGELLTAVLLPPGPLACGYAKERIRGAFDFPLAGVAVALDVAAARLRGLRVAVTGTNSRPFLLQGTEDLLASDGPLLAALDKLVQKQVHPMRTTLTQANYRRIVAGVLARRLVSRLAVAAGVHVH